MSADVLVLPELFLTGYNIGQVVHELAESRVGPSLAAIRQTAQQSACALCVGFPEREGGKVFNSTALINSRGEQICVYRKTHLFGEQETALFSRGEELAVAMLGGRHVGLAICYDIEFPEFARALKRQGAEAVLVPTANMEPYAEVPTTPREGPRARECRDRRLRQSLRLGERYGIHWAQLYHGPGRPRSCACGRQYRGLAGGRASANREPRTSVFTAGRSSVVARC